MPSIHIQSNRKPENLTISIFLEIKIVSGKKKNSRH